MGKKKKRREDRAIVIPYEEVGEGPSWFWIGVTLLVPGLQWLTPFLLISKLLKMGKSKRLGLYRSYAAIIGQREEVDVNELSSKLQRPRAAVIHDLQEMIDKGFMGQDAYVDRARGRLITGLSEKEEPEQYEIPRVVLEKVRSEKPEAPVPQPEPEKPPVKVIRPMSQMSAKESDFEAILRKMRSLNEQIDDPEVSESIDRIGSLTADIFRVVRQHPERSDEVKKFMTYYLPVTLKLLEDYSLMEKQSYQSQHIRESRQKIAELLKTLIKAYEKQLDNLFQKDAMDVDADISVMQTMLAKDGLVSTGGTDIREMLKKQTAN